VGFQYAMSWQLIHDMAARYERELDLGEAIVNAGGLRAWPRSDVVGVPARGGPIELPFTAVITFRDGLMAGEHTWFDLKCFCEQAGADSSSIGDAAGELAGAASSRIG
jgi:hypothetical protein